MNIPVDKKEYAMIPQGSHVARCVSVIYLGHQEQEWQGEKWLAPKIRVAWETPLETHVFDETKGEQPFMVNKEYTLSFTDKSNLKKDLDGWGIKVNPNTDNFDAEILIGKTCLVNVQHKQSKTGGKTYANVIGLSPLPKGMICPDQVNPTVVFSVLEWDDDRFMKLPAFLREKIMKSDEYIKRAAGQGQPIHGEKDDDLPF